MELKQFSVAATVLLAGLISGCAGNPQSAAAPSPVVPDAAPSGPILEALAMPVAVRKPLPATVWTELRAGFGLDHAAERSEVVRALAWLENQPDLMRDIQPRLQRYLPYLINAVRERDLPLELALIPVIESTFDPYAFSPGGAAGLWQLIPATARHHGVTINWWYDGRRDPVDSTRAALDYLQYLHRRFDDWLLVLAAYNAGEGRVSRAMRRSGGSTFWELNLPTETQHYVPRLLAVAYAIEQPAALDLPRLPDRPAFVITQVDQQVDLTAVAGDARVPLEEIFRFNPGLNRGATPPDGPHRLLLPKEFAEPLQLALQSYPDDAQQWRRYRVRAGDSLSTIAVKHDTSVAAIRASNTITGHLIRVGDSLLIPSASLSTSGVPTNPLLVGRGASYRVASGDSLWTISRRYRTSIDALIRANRLDPRAPLRIGQKLVVPGKSADRRVNYRVRSGDSLAGIASRFKVKIRDIARWNRIAVSDYIQPGQKLVLYISLSDSYS